MPNGDRALDFEAILKTTDFKKELGDLERRITGFASKTVSETKRVDDTFSKLGTAAAGIFAANQLSQLPGQIIKVRGEYQNLEIALTTILKSKSAADKVLADGAKLAATTPFTFTEVGQGIKQLLAYGSSASNVVNEVRTLGDVAAGVSAPLGDLIYLYGTLRTQGRAYATDIQQFAGRGIPIYEELGKVLKINTSEVRGFVEAGKVGFKEVEQVFKNLTSLGGQFEGLTQKTSKSLTGLLSNLEDSIDQAFNKIGQSQEGLIASGILTATELVQNYEKIIDVLKVVVATYGAYRAALLVTSAVQAAQNVGILIQGYVNLSTALGPLTAQQLAFNSAVSINPYVLLATVIVGLASAVYVLSDRTTAAENATKSLNKLEEQSSKIKADLTSKTNELVSSIRSETSTRLTQLDAFQKLQGLYPSLFANMDLETFKKLDATEAQKQLNKAIESNDTKRLEQDYVNAKKKTEELTKTVNDLTQALALSGNQKGGIGKQLDESKKLLEEANIKAQQLSEKVAKRKQLEYEANTPIAEQVKHYEGIRVSLESKVKSLQEAITKEKLVNQGAETMKSIFANITLQNVNKELSEVLSKLANINTDSKETVVNNKAYYEGIKKTNQDLLDGLAYNQRGSAEWKKYSAAVAEAEKKLQAWSGTSKKAVTKKSEEVFKEGSIKYFEQIAQKAQEVIEKTPFTNKAVIEKQQQIRLNAEEQAEKLRRSLVVRSFDDELEYKRQQYELYNSWVVYQGKAAADGQFAELVKTGTTYREFLQSEITKLEGKITAGTATPQDKTNLITAKVSLSITDESFENYKNRIIDARKEVATLTDYIRILNEEQDKIDKIGGADKDTVLFLSQELISAQKERQQLLKDFIIENNVAGKQQLQIQSYYSDLRTQLDKENADKKTAFYQEALAKINKSEQEALAERAADEVKRTSQTYKELESVVQASTIRTLKIQKEAIETKLQALRIGGASESEEYRQQERALILINKGIEKATLDSYSELANIFGQIGQELQGLGGDLATIGASLADAASKTSSVFNVIEKYNNAKAEKDEKQRKALTADAKQASQMMLLQTAINGVIDAINNIGSAYNRNKDLQKQYYNTVKSQQIEYNKLLNDEIRLKSQNTGNPFLKDYAAIFGNSALAKADALKKFNEQLAILQDSGKAKDGTKVSVDFLQIISGFLSNPIGNFGKGIGTKDALTPIFEKYPDLIDKSKQGVESFNLSLAKSLIATNAVDEATKEQLQTVIDWAGKYEEAQKQLQDTLVDLVGQIGNDLQNAFEEAFRTGSDAAQAFGKVVGDVIGRIARQMVFESLMRPIIDQFSKDTKASYDVLNGGDGTIADDLDRLGKGSAIIAPKLEEAYKAIDKMLIETGYSKSAIGGTGSSSSSGLSGAVKSITEETAGLIAGQFNALRITSASTLQVNREQLLALTNISNNSNFLKKLDLLESIDRKLGNNDLRAGGVG